MPRNLLVLLAVAGLLASTLASPCADLATPDKRLDGRHPNSDSARTQATKSKGVVLPPGIDVNKVIQQVRHGPRFESPLRLDADPFAGHVESMAAPTIVPISSSGNQGYASVAFDNDTTYLVVWADQFGTSSSGIYGARVTQSGTVRDWNGGILISNAGNAQENPSVAFDGTNYLVVWHDNRNGNYDIYGARVTKAGVVLDASGKAVSTYQNGQYFPSVAYDGTNYLVVWQDARNWNSYRYDIYGQRVDTSGGLVGSAIMICSANGNQTAPSVAFDGTNYLVAWQDTSSTGSDICGIRVSTGGALLGSKITISNATNNQQSPSVAYGNGYYLVAWQDYRSGTTWDIYGARVNTSGSVYGPIAVSTASDNQQSPSVAYCSGYYLVAWQDYRNSALYSDIYGARLDTSGTVLDGNGIALSLAGNSQEYPAVISSASTGFLAVWQDTRNGNTNYDICGTRVNAGGSVGDYPNGILVTGNVNVQANPAIAFDGTKYLVVWEDNRSGNTDICGARVSLSGAAMDRTGFVISSNTPSSNQTYPAVAFDGTNYLVVWQDARNSSTGLDIYGARVSMLGAVLDASGIAISAAAGNQYFPSVAFDGTNYLVVWHDFRNSTTYSDVYGARVTTAGAVVDQGSNAIPISTAGNNQQQPSVAFDGTNYLAVWHDNRGADYDVYGTRVSKAGAVLDAGGLAISAAAGNQYYPEVSFDGTNYLVVWHDYRSNSTWDIYGARISVAGMVLDASGVPVSTAANNQQQPAVAFDGANYLVVWQDLRNGGLYSDIYGRRVTRAGQVGEEYAISTQTNSQSSPVVACGEGTLLVTYQSLTGVVGRVNYHDTLRVWARLGTLSLTADVGTDVILRPTGSFLLPSDEIPPRAVVKNYGSEASIPFNVRLSISPTNPSGYPCTLYVSSLEAGQEDTVDFDVFDLEAGTFTITCSTMLYADQHSSNDTRISLFQGCDFIDYGDLGGDSGLTCTGQNNHWELNVPSSDWTQPFMDDNAWGDQLDASYEDNEDGYLVSPVFTAQNANPAIAFQHNVCTDSLADGGNFEYQIGTGNWTMTEPSAGFPYNGTVTALGAPGWSGWKDAQSGWKQSVFTIPADEDDQFSVRWHFASGTGGNYKGWLIDEIAGIGCYWHEPPPLPSGRGTEIDTMNVYPNLVRGPAQVNYTLKKDCNVSINLFDASGRLAARVPTNGFKKGRNTARLDASGLASGVYFVKIKGETDIKTAKIIIE